MNKLVILFDVDRFIYFCLMNRNDRMKTLKCFSFALKKHIMRVYLERSNIINREKMLLEDVWGSLGRILSALHKT